jgi:hypothetical protein
MGMNWEKMNIRQIQTNFRGIKKTHLLLAFLLVLGFVTSLITVRNASAAQALQTMVRFDQITTSTATTGTVCLKTTASGSTENYVKVTYPTGYTLGAFGTFTVNTTNTGWPTGANAWTGITAPTGAGDISGQTVKFASGALSDSTLYCFNWTNSSAVQTQGSTSSANTGTVETYTSGNALIDHGDYATPTVSGDTITVNATVPPSFSFALSGSGDTLPTLDTSTPKTSSSPVTATVNTNATNGWQIWAHSVLTNGGLHSSNANHTIASNCSGDQRSRRLQHWRSPHHRYRFRFGSNCIRPRIDQLQGWWSL